MALQSMTGFARSADVHEAEGAVTRIVWEIRSVNGKGLDIRLRLPQGFEALEHTARAALGRAFSRGNFQVSLNVERPDAQVSLTINETLLADLIRISQDLSARHGLAPATLDGLLSMRGILDQPQDQPDEQSQTALNADVLKCLEQVLTDLGDARRSEGNALEVILSRQVERIEALAQAARLDPSRSVDVIRSRLASQVALLLDASRGLDESRLHMEAAFLATKADIQEELDRLDTHVASARALISEGGPIGRKLDFLSQEFNRETNTLCSKSNAAAITAIGLELKAVVDQFREQVQNLE